MLPGSNLYIPTVKFKNEYINLISRIPIVAAWGNLDGANYIKVARTGYVKADLGFFPLYPLLMNVLFVLTGLSRIIIGQLISLFCLGISFYLFYKLILLDKYKVYIASFLVFVLIYPTAYYYGAAYNDSLFLVLATATIYFGRKNNIVLAVICSFFATLARLNGLALIFFLFFEGYIQITGNDQFVLKLTDKKQVFLLCKNALFYLFPLVAFLAYLIYIHIIFGSWTMLFSSMKQWGQDQMVFPLQTVYRYVIIIYFC
jgi:Gpi18-like mannosyltransferase